VNRALISGLELRSGGPCDYGQAALRKRAKFDDCGVIEVNGTAAKRFMKEAPPMSRTVAARTARSIRKPAAAAASAAALSAGAVLSAFTNNLLAGGGYSIYGGATNEAAYGVPTNIVITGNRFATTYYSTGGAYGTVSYFDKAGTGNKWTTNTWDTTGATIPTP
jgi:hypothetical protein